MEREDFKINQLFFTHSGQWMCTDVGTRTITAVDYKTYLESGDKSAPYSIVEYSFDMYDMDGCWRSEDFEDGVIENLEVLKEKNSDDSIFRLRSKLRLKHRSFFDWLENYLYKEDIINIAQDGVEDEYALERDEILMGITEIQTLKSLTELIVSIFKESFDAAALKVEKKRYEALAEKIWIAYWYLNGRDNLRDGNMLL